MFSAKRKKHVALGAVLAGLLLMQSDLSLASQSDLERNEPCLRCHGMETFGYVKPETGKLVSLSVSQAALDQADHRGNLCVDCHRGGYRKTPHPQHKVTADTCLECHEDERGFEKYRMKAITAHFKKSVHYKMQPEQFNCFSCHDPHAGRLHKIGDATVTVVEKSNKVCLNCHSTLLPFEESHAWLPNGQLHQEAVRCLECHTPRPSSVVHAIEPAAKAEKDCVACHSRDSILLTKLNKYRLGRGEDKLGFVNSVVMDDSYVLGMTRHSALDTLGIFAVALTVSGVSAHGIGRWFSRRRGKSS